MPHVSAGLQLTGRPQKQRRPVNSALKGIAIYWPPVVSGQLSLLSTACIMARLRSLVNNFVPLGTIYFASNSADKRKQSAGGYIPSPSNTLPSEE